MQGRPTACIYTHILGVRGKQVKVIDSPTGKLGVVPFLVWRVVLLPFGMVSAADGTVWFTLAEPKGDGA